MHRIPRDRDELSELPPAYRRWRGSTLGRTTDALERALILELIGNVGGMTILDVGCGDGDLAVELWKRGARVSGIDASAQMIEAARDRARRHEANITFDVASVESIPFPSETFDRVTAVAVLCFVGDETSAIREMARVLRPGGRLVIGELGKLSVWATMRRIRGWLGNRVWRRARFRSTGGLRRLAGGAGLAVEALRGAIFYPPCGLAAWLLGAVDRHLGRLTTFGAAFLVLSATKPPGGRAERP